MENKSTIFAFKTGYLLTLLVFSNLGQGACSSDYFAKIGVFELLMDIIFATSCTFDCGPRGLWWGIAKVYTLHYCEFLQANGLFASFAFRTLSPFPGIF